MQCDSVSGNPKGPRKEAAVVVAAQAPTRDTARVVVEPSPKGGITQIEAVVLSHREVITPPTKQTKVGVILIINHTQVRQYNSMMP